MVGVKTAYLNKHTPEAQEWYTPPYIIELARDVMGSIDTDPASCDLAQEWIKASVFYTLSNSGLSRNWSGNVWLNPPFNNVKSFVPHLLTNINNLWVTQAILLTHNCTDSRWWHMAADMAQAVCFTKGRLSFINATNNKNAAASRGQTFMYFGYAKSKFRDVFSLVGRVYYE
jgi:ParB family transcriptional regulator, chromosome partitioning protein